MFNIFNKRFNRCSRTQVQRVPRNNQIGCFFCNLFFQFRVDDCFFITSKFNVLDIFNSLRTAMYPVNLSGFCQFVKISSDCHIRNVKSFNQIVDINDAFFVNCLLNCNQSFFFEHFIISRHFTSNISYLLTRLTRKTLLS